VRRVGAPLHELQKSEFVLFERFSIVRSC
jgi:hypothetical protein